MVNDAGSLLPFTVILLYNKFSEERELNLDKLFVVLMWEMQQILTKIWNIAPRLRGSEAQLSRSSAAIHLHVTARTVCTRDAFICKCVTSP